MRTRIFQVTRIYLGKKLRLRGTSDQRRFSRGDIRYLSCRCTAFNTLYLALPLKESSKFAMASGHASHYQQAQSRNGASRTALHQIQTQPTRNNRYSYQETPQEHQAATFQPFSPTSPINEVSTSPHNDYIHSYQQQDSNTAQYPREKDPALHNESTSPYGFRPPQQVHPAYFAPIADNGPHAPIMQVQTSTPISPYHSADPLPAKISENNNDLKPSSNAPGSPKYQTIRHETPHFDAPPQRSTADRTTHVYNPDSLAGPNGAPVEKHLPGQVAHPNSTVDPHWKHGLCEPDAVCCLGLFCPCIVYGKTQYRLSRKAEKKDPTDVLGWEKVNGSCGVMAVACGLQCKTCPCLPLSTSSPLS